MNVFRRVENNGAMNKKSLFIITALDSLLNYSQRNLWLNKRTQASQTNSANKAVKIPQIWGIRKHARVLLTRITCNL